MPQNNVSFDTSYNFVQTIRYLLGRREFRVNEVYGKGFTPLDVIELECMLRDSRNLEIQGLLIRSGVLSVLGTLTTSRSFSCKINGSFRKTPTFVNYIESTDTSLKVKVEQLSFLQCDIVKKFLKKKHSWLRKKHNSVRKKMEKEHSWVEKNPNSLMVASVIAAIAYQAALNPPGGVWTDDKQAFANDIKNKAGTPIMVGTSILATYNPEI